MHPFCYSQPAIFREVLKRQNHRQTSGLSPSELIENEFEVKLMLNQWLYGVFLHLIGLNCFALRFILQLNSSLRFPLSHRVSRHDVVPFLLKTAAPKFRDLTRLTRIFAHDKNQNETNIVQTFVYGFCLTLNGFIHVYWTCREATVLFLHRKNSVLLWRVSRVFIIRLGVRLIVCRGEK